MKEKTRLEQYLDIELKKFGEILSVFIRFQREYVEFILLIYFRQHRSI